MGISIVTGGAGFIGSHIARATGLTNANKVHSLNKNKRLCAEGTPRVENYYILHKNCK